MRNSFIYRARKEAIKYLIYLMGKPLKFIAINVRRCIRNIRNHVHILSKYISKSKHFSILQLSEKKVHTRNFMNHIVDILKKILFFVPLTLACNYFYNV